MTIFSVLTPVRNSEAFILGCLDSVAHQGIELEHIIQDSNSTDLTMEIIGNFGKTFSHVKAISETDAGQSDALNRLLDRATGEYIGWLNSDETYLPGTLEKVVQVFEQTGADVVYGDCIFVDEHGSSLRLYSNHKYSSAVLSNTGCFIPSCATFFRAESIREFQFDVRLKRCMDWDLYLTLRNRRFEYLKSTLSTFAVHSNQVTNSPESEASQEFGLLQKKHKLSRNPALEKPRLKYRAVRIFLKISNGNYVRELLFLLQCKLKYWNR